MTDMRRVVLESPYAGNIERNVRYARRALRDCLKRGEAPIASHLLFTQPAVLDDGIPEERQLGIAAGLAWLTSADAMVVYVDYGISPGMLKAIDYADNVRTPVEYRRIGRNDTGQGCAAAPQAKLFGIGRNQAYEAAARGEDG